MILTCEELYKCSQNPRINQINLDLLREYYETYLIPYAFQFEVILEDDNAEEIELRFGKENFCHLLAIDSILRYTISKKNISEYKGNPGWDNVVNGKINFNILRQKKNKKRFDSRKDKYVFFYLIPQILHSPQGIKYNIGFVKSGTNIDCEILLYHQHLSAYVHIGIKKDEELGYYIPKTFFVERITTKNSGLKYIENQKELNIILSKKSNVEINNESI